MLQSLHFNIDLLSPQLTSVDDAENTLAQSWKNQIQSLRMSLRNANIQAKANMKKAAQQEREMVLGGGEESTTRRRNFQTKGGMTSAAESITESLRQTRHLMEVIQSASTLMTFGMLLFIQTSYIDWKRGIAGVLTKAEIEYKVHRSLLSWTRNLLSTMLRQGVLDRMILVVGFLLFSLAVIYVVSKRIGIFKLQRQVIASV